MSRKLLELARRAEQVVEIAGEKIRVLEPNGMQMIEFRRRKDGVKADADAGVAALPPDITSAIAHLVAHCCVDEEGKRLYTEEEARILVDGRAEVSLPLLIAVSSFDTQQKKTS